MKTSALKPAQNSNKKSNKKKPVMIDDCWRRIGVRGDKSCPELKVNQHCHNCDVYARAGRQLLDRKLPNDHIQTWTKILSAPAEDLLSGKKSLFVFRIGKEWLALPTSMLVEVLEHRDIHFIPHRSNQTLLGLINVQGEMQLCFSAAKRLGIDKSKSEQNKIHQKVTSRILLVSQEGEELAFLSDEVYGVQLYHEKEVQPLPVTISSEKDSLSKGLLVWEQGHVAVLDGSLLFNALMESLR
ncbi:MAG: chemotaxis protein CheW [Ghiorsea sp.]